MSPALPVPCWHTQAPKIEAGAHTQPAAALQCQCPAPLYFAGALPRPEFDQMALEVQEADGDLLQKSSALEPQVMLCDLVFSLKNDNKKAPGLL